MKRFIIVAIIFSSIFFASIGIYACEMQFSLISSDKSVNRISPTKNVRISLGETYILKIEFIEDHKNCITPPEETKYLLQDEKWKVTKDYLPLQLILQDDWEKESTHVWKQEITFKALKKGSWELEVLRDCTKGGYDEFITFIVKSN